jgi:nucleoside-diphosphate-sugar epimerase
VIALVTGASGFIGRHLVGALAESGAEVHAVVREQSARSAPPLPESHLHRLTQPAAEIGAVVEAVQPSVVFHLATHFTARHHASEIISMLESNVIFGSTLAQACAQQQVRMVHATSAWQHYRGAEYEPVSLYAATKQALVDIVDYFSLVEGLDAREVCLFDTYGPQDDRGKLVSALLSAARNGAPMPMSSGHQLTDLVHVRDVVEALLLAAESPRFGRRMVVRTGEPITIRQLAEIVATISGRQLSLQWGARPDRGREMVTDWAIPGDNLGWRATTALTDGLAELWEHP